jgi:hypothetical protein
MVILQEGGPIMLSPHVIAEILKREALERADKRPQLTLDLPVFYAPPSAPEAKEERGVFIIEL